MKKIMIAVDDSLHSKNAVRYAARIPVWVKNMSYVLFHVQPMLSQYLEDEAGTDFKSRNQLNQIKAKNIEASRQLLEQYKSQMVGTGIEESQIQIVTQPRNLGIAKDIIEYALKGKYDALVLGRRGISGLIEFFMGSVSSNIVQNSKVTPVWMIDGNVTPAKILVPIDGSEYSLRAIDHLAFIVSDHSDLNLTFLHVIPKLKNFCEIDFEIKEADAFEDLIIKANQNCIDNFYDLALKKLKEFGIKEDQIEIKTVTQPLSIGAPIVDEVQTGNFDTVVMGRSGINKRFFTGSVTNYVLNNISNAAIWIVP
ncbi:MAG: universal stress protein [Desulfobulbaceae bacterium]|nr:universal stress protein [Desulfobulbaceae bacterium]